MKKTIGLWMTGLGLVLGAVPPPVLGDYGIQKGVV